MSDAKDCNLTSWEFAAAGAFSGFVTRFCCQPLDVLKILFQLQIEPKFSSKYKSIHQAVGVIIKEEGVTALWKGHIPAQCLSIVYGAVQFSGYENILSLGRELAANHNGVLLNETALHFYAGSISGVGAITISFPLDTIRTRLIAQTKSKQYKGVFDAAKQIYVQEGMRGFFRGLLPACAQIAPSSGLIFGFKNIYTQIWNLCMLDAPDSFQVTAKGHMVTGLLAGITSKTIVYPLDVVKKRLQIQGMDEGSICLNKKSRCTGLINCIALTLRNEGFFGLYKGFLPAALKSGIANSINFTIYNEICYILDVVKMKR